MAIILLLKCSLNYFFHYHSGVLGEANGSPAHGGALHFGRYVEQDGVPLVFPCHHEAAVRYLAVVRIMEVVRETRTRRSDVTIARVFLVPWGEVKVGQRGPGMDCNLKVEDCGNYVAVAEAAHSG